MPGAVRYLVGSIQEACTAMTAMKAGSVGRLRHAIKGTRPGRLLHGTSAVLVSDTLCDAGQALQNVAQAHRRDLAGSAGSCMRLIRACSFSARRGTLAEKPSACTRTLHNCGAHARTNRCSFSSMIPCRGCREACSEATCPHHAVADAELHGI